MSKAVLVQTTGALVDTLQIAYKVFDEFIKTKGTTAWQTFLETFSETLQALLYFPSNDWLLQSIQETIWATLEWRGCTTTALDFATQVVVCVLCCLEVWQDSVILQCEINEQNLNKSFLAF